jgi:hypothetical protein
MPHGAQSEHFKMDVRPPPIPGGAAAVEIERQRHLHGYTARLQDETIPRPGNAGKVGTFVPR